ncbi:MAG: DUF2155 domain-containing protein [Rhodospirillales bacterium]|nr:DUF2155 domain-containing protein [Rhodospirillales bacterium]
MMLAAPAAAQQTFEPYAFAVLGGMDKVTGHISTLDLPVGVTGVFGTLEVTPRSCQKTPPHEAPESASFLQIRDYRTGESETVFSGWMFASTPGVSTLEHPVYDIWVIDCTNSASSPGSSE